MSTHVDAVRDLGTPIKGPSALQGDWRRFVALTWTLAVQEFKLRFFGSALGYLWQLMRPLMLFGVLYVVFTQAIKLGAEAKFFPAVLLTSIVTFTFFGEATSGAVTSVVDRENLVRKIQFPRLVVPAAVVLTAGFNLVLNFVAVGIFIAASGVSVHGSWVQIPLVLGVLAMFASGLAMLLSALYVRYRDVKPIWDVLLQATFYATPIIYVIETVEVRWAQQLMLCNPLAVVVQQLRHAVIDPTAPSAAEVIGGWDMMLIPLGLVVILFALGFWVYDREAPGIAEEL